MHGDFRHQYKEELEINEQDHLDTRTVYLSLWHKSLDREIGTVQITMHSDKIRWDVVIELEHWDYCGPGENIMFGGQRFNTWDEAVDFFEDMVEFLNCDWELDCIFDKIRKPN